MTSVLLLFLLMKGTNHETSQNVQISLSPVFYQGGVSLSQEKLLYQSDARRHPALTDALLQAPSRLPSIDNQSQDGETLDCLLD